VRWLICRFLRYIFYDRQGSALPLALHKTNLAEVMMVYANFSEKSTSLQRHLNKNIDYDCTANPVADANQGTAQQFYLCSTFCLISFW
jgi:hypothetical protein